MKHAILIGANEASNGTFNFYFRSKAGWKYQMNIINCHGAIDMYQIAPLMTQEEYDALPNQYDASFIDKIKTTTT